LTVNIQYYDDRTTLFGCGCSYRPTREDGDYCPHETRQMPSVDLLEPFRANIRTLNVRYLRNHTFDAGIMEDILKTPFFLKSFPNLESLRWSCRHFDEMAPPFKLPRRLFGSSLPRLQKLSMVNCWGLLLTDTPTLKAMSVECTDRENQTEISANQLVLSLRRRQSLASLSFINCHITPDAETAPGPVSMKNLKEIILRKADSDIVSRYIRCPSMGTITTIRIASFTQSVWADKWSSIITATDGFGGSISGLVCLANDGTLKTTWGDFATAFRHAVTALEIEAHHMNVNGVVALPALAEVLPNLHTVRAQLPPVPVWFNALKVLVSKCGITRVERLVVGTEDPDEARRNDEEWELLCTKYELHDFLK